ncbi:sigma factor G inhibitor Gin [Alkaliphilus peptidifermentans]|uniref:sigma factor G inhibitor Gin n=1 Tax=Alkaliphilus peptidifermentans TaxID=426129 RepID=UPI0015A3767D|nr:sigma factor G inhibitor Gin [Alkaliphilus peptidifermentans]
MKDEKLQCFICNHQDNTGIALLNQFICSRCERKIVNTSPSQIKYQLFKEKIKLLWAR